MIHVRLARPILSVFFGSVLTVALMSPTSSHAQSEETKAAAGESESSPLDERAMDKLKAMADVLKAAKSMKIHTLAFFDEVEESGIKNKRFIRYVISLRRPDKLRFTSTLDNGDFREGYFNGKHLIVANPREKTFVRLEVAGNVDTLLDTLHDKHAMSPPVADLLYSDIFAAQKPYILSGAYLGVRLLGDLELDHLSFESTGAEWQLWLQKGGQPLPVRMLIRFMENKGEPEYMMTFLNWELNTVTDEELALAVSADWTLTTNVVAE